MVSEWMPRWTVFITVFLLFIGVINFLFAGISLTTQPNVNMSDVNTNTSLIDTTVNALSFGYISYAPARWIMTSFFWILVMVDAFLIWGWASSLLGRS
jgi:hypothetical protein